MWQDSILRGLISVVGLMTTNVNFSQEGWCPAPLPNRPVSHLYYGFNDFFFFGLGHCPIYKKFHTTLRWICHVKIVLFVSRRCKKPFLFAESLRLTVTSTPPPPNKSVNNWPPLPQIAKIWCSESNFGLRGRKSRLEKNT